MARVFQYVRPVNAVLTNVLLGHRPDPSENGIRIKEEPPDLIFDDLDSLLTDVNTAAQNVPAIPEHQHLNVNNESNENKRRRRTKSVNSNKDSGVARKKRKRNINDSSDLQDSHSAKRPRLFANDANEHLQTDAPLTEKKSDKSTVMCETCFVHFDSTQSLTFHLRAFNNMMFCEICSAVYNSRQRLENHFSVHFRRSSITGCRSKPGCWFCQRQFRNKKFLQMHVFHCHKNLLDDEYCSANDIDELLNIISQSSVEALTNDTDKVERNTRTRRTRIRVTKSGDKIEKNTGTKDATISVNSDANNVEKDTREENPTMGVVNEVSKTKRNTRTRSVPVRVTRNSERIRQNTSVESSAISATNGVDKNPPVEDSTTRVTSNLSQAKENTRVEDARVKGTRAEDLVCISSDAIKVERDIWLEDKIVTVTSDDETTCMEDIMNIIGVTSTSDQNSSSEDIAEGVTNDVTNINGVTNDIDNVADVNNDAAGIVDVPSNTTNMVGVANGVAQRKEHVATENSVDSAIDGNVRMEDATVTATKDVDKNGGNAPMKANADGVRKHIVEVEQNTGIKDSTICVTSDIVKIEPVINDDTSVGDSVDSVIVDDNQVDLNTPKGDNVSCVISAIVKTEPDIPATNSVDSVMINADQIAPNPLIKNNVISAAKETDKPQRNVSTPKSVGNKKRIRKTVSVAKSSTPTKLNVSSPGRKGMRQTILNEFVSSSGTDLKDGCIKVETVDIPEDSFNISEQNTRSTTMGCSSTPTSKPPVRNSPIHATGRNTPLLRMHMSPDSLYSLLNDQIKIEQVDPFSTNTAHSSPYNLRKSTHDSRRSSVDSRDTTPSSTSSTKFRPTYPTRHARKPGITLEERWKKKYNCKECVIRLKRCDYVPKETLIKTERSKNVIPLQLTIAKTDGTSINCKESGSPKIRIVNFNNCIVVELLEPR